MKIRITKGNNPTTFIDALLQDFIEYDDFTITPLQDDVKVEYGTTCGDTILFENDVVIWKGETSNGQCFRHKCVVVYDDIEFTGFCLKNLDYDAGLIPIGLYGALSDEIYKCNEIKR